MGNYQLGMTSNKSLFFIFSIVCALLYFTNPKHSDEFTGYISSVIGKDDNETIRYGASPKGSPIESIDNEESVHEVRDVAFECRAPALGSVALQRTQGVYAWVDDKGVKTFSDVKPKHFAQEIVVTSKDALDFFDLNVVTPNQNYLLRNQIESRLYAVFRAYSALLGLKKMQRVQLDIEVLASRAQYQKMLKQLNHVNLSSVGVYSHELKKAYVLYQGEKHTVKTAIHEAVHAINHTLLGSTPRWLNEGLAEYFEEIETNMQYAEVVANSQWTKQGYLSNSVVAPLTLLDNSKQWRGDDAFRMYRSSWAFIHFLMDTQRQAKLRALLIAESDNPCDVLTAKAVSDILGFTGSNMTSDYTKFTQSPVLPHRL